MPNHPWFKFYPSDWRADQMLRLCSPAARGLWLECMCLMHEARPYGHLLVNGRAVTDAQLGVLAGIPPDQTANLIAELDAAGVFSRRDDGVIYSRRMTRDAEKAAAGAVYGKRGGNPALMARVNPASKDGGSPRVQNPEPESESESESDSRTLTNVVRSLKGEAPWTPAQKKAAWQSKICVEAQAIMTDADYARFLVDWAAGEPAAKKTAERIDAALKAAKARIAAR
ncbi:MAG: hypothetical protein K1X51_13230 [Rhodospirillaceae bacterium]|nr:hypothetical protein [Rhodospirillaceae bacterium]